MSDTTLLIIIAFALSLLITIAVIYPEKLVLVPEQLPQYTQHITSPPMVITRESIKL